MPPSTSQQSNQLRVKVNEVAPSLLLPSAELGSRTPMHLVHISNRKLNREVFSSRDRSIHRRIVIKNFLTELYQLHPIEWIEPSPAMDDQDQWLEQTLSAAGIDSQDDDDTDIVHSSYPDDYYTDSDSTNPNLAELSPSAAAAASMVTSRRRPLSLRSNKVPLPRPASVELSQSLHSYLSTVFDVNWSVGQSNTEDSFVTASSSPSSSPSPSTPSSLSSSSSGSSSSRSQALSSRRPSSPPSSSSGRRTIESRMEPEPTIGKDSTHRHQHDYLHEVSLQGQGSSNSSSYSSNRSTNINYKVDESHHHHQQQRQGDSRPNTAPLSHRHGNNNNMAMSSPRAGPESSRTPPLSSKALLTKPSEKQTPSSRSSTPPPRPERPSSPSAMPYTLSFDPDPSLSMPLQPNYAVSTTTTAYEPISVLAPQQHIHNHIHIHVHNYPTESTNASTPTPPRRPTTPTRSSRYPKPPPPRPTQTTTTTTTEYISYSTDYSQSIHSQWAADPKAILAATATATANLPPTWQPASLESLVPTSSTTTSSYPPEKSANSLLNGSSRDMAVADQEEEQPYLATSPLTSSRYPRSPPPPPYTQSADQSPFAAPLSPSLTPSAFSPYEQQGSPKQQYQPIVYSFTPVLTTQPQSAAMASNTSANTSASQKLLQYQQYQERQKMFVRDESDKEESSKSSLDGLGFIRRLSRQSSKKKNPLASISAPLPSTLSYSSSSASATTSLSVAVPLHTIGGGLERYHDDQLSSTAGSNCSPRYSLQPVAKTKNAVSMLKGTLSSVKSGLARASSPTLSPAMTSSSSSSIGPIGPPMTMSSSALAYGAVVPKTLPHHQQLYHYPTTSSTSSSAPSSPAMVATVL
ncbi:hypothetical protein BGW39_010220 [Mortierella sp. 14UC]|nr:hypothetical protein BGW39_010220 [Mortierella sp. 14UC]